MKILVACEFSGVIRDAFRNAGHEAFSCDLIGVEPLGQYRQHHYAGDCLDYLNLKWDILIAHPPCTYLTVSAAWAFKDGPYHQKVKTGTLVGAARREGRGCRIRQGTMESAGSGRLS